MKKLILGLAALPLLASLATSCDKESVETKVEEGKYLTFKATTGKHTISRATETDIDYLQTQTLDITTVVVSDGSPHDNYSISYGDGEWTYSPLDIHPNFALLHYSVHPTKTLTADEESASFDYVYNGSDDLVAAAATSTYASSTAQLTYNHLLSQINFAITGAENTIVTITDIKLSGVNSEATCTIASGTGLGSWTNIDTPLVDDNAIAYTTSNNATDGTTTPVYLGNTSTGATNNSNAIMIIPQPASGVTLNFHYKITNTANTMTYEDKDVSVNFDELGVSDWEAGNRYLYTINFDINYLQFNVVKVNDWSEDIGNTYNVN